MRNLALMWVLAGVAVALLAAGDGKPSVSTFTDKRDGKVYKIVRIGSQVWFAENLNYDTIGSVCYENKAENCAKYGRLYDWNTAMTACPVGTHLPTAEELTALVDYVGGEKNAGKKLKSTSGWNEDGNGTDNYGFSALPGGQGDNETPFCNVGGSGTWWSATAGWQRLINRRGVHIGPRVLSMYYHSESARLRTTETYLYSVRCVLNDEKEKRK